MHCAELVRFTDVLKASSDLSKDNSLKDVRKVLESMENPPEVILEEAKRVHSTESKLFLKFGENVLSLRIVISKHAYSVISSTVELDGEEYDWAWNKEFDKFKFDASNAERVALHNFLTAVVNAL